jgi:glutamate---cysteine ligase / carboxylate-amine ligase
MQKQITVSPRACKLDFTPSRFLTLGVEVEVYLVDPVSGAQLGAGPQIIPRLASDPSFRPESLTTILEFCTGVCSNLQTVEAQLGQSAQRLVQETSKAGIAFMSAGTHPFAGPGRMEHVWPAPRYQQLIQRDRWLGLVANTVGLHVHVGARSGEHAIQLINGVSPYLSHLLALSANSPYLNGEDTGLASSRVTCYESQPTAGPAPTLGCWADFEELVGSLSRSGSIESLKDLHWDIRPVPSFGTVEVRICDGQSNLDDTLALVSAIRWLFAWIDQRIQQGEPMTPPSGWRLRENKWRALRWGLDAEVLVNDAGEVRSMRDEWQRLLAAFAPIARRLGDTQYLRRVEQLLAHPGYERQRRIVEQCGSQAGLVQALSAQGWGRRALPKPQLLQVNKPALRSAPAAQPRKRSPKPA